MLLHRGLKLIFIPTPLQMVCHTSYFKQWCLCIYTHGRRDCRHRCLALVVFVAAAAAVAGFVAVSVTVLVVVVVVLFSCCF